MISVPGGTGDIPCGYDIALRAMIYASRMRGTGDIRFAYGGLTDGDLVVIIRKNPRGEELP